jgi:hypothetical protein
MDTHSKSDSTIQGLAGPLFDWRTVVVSKPATRAGQYLRRRFSVPPASHADLIATLAGLDCKEIE